MKPDGTGDFVVIAATVQDIAAADAAFELLMSCGCDGQLVRDVVTIGRKSSGEVRFDRESVVRGDSETRPGWSAAAGLAAALYPSVGADLPTDRTAERAVLHAVAGQVALAVGRQGLMRFGEHLDAAPAAVIVAAPPRPDRRFFRSSPALVGRSPGRRPSTHPA